MLYKIYAEPFLLPRADIPKAETYRQAYAELPVARSGYPSFERARQVVDRLLRADFVLIHRARTRAPQPVPVVRPKHHFCR